MNKKRMGSDGPKDPTLCYFAAQVPPKYLLGSKIVMKSTRQENRLSHSFEEKGVDIFKLFP
ncbi:hypothetical protein GCM10027275_29300 [Rhabdobacter roseus]|uniref:Uncharacterized protein n=1 Tax=Rhabdobacter roseus TaxID=1655419 RepID=A0A840TMM9_9BACT|nr:hypothetical protein [Rhabdobacter roseus]MBB5284881.1 hypothetical protein [Rhabdobacter roseus]